MIRLSHSTVLLAALAALPQTARANPTAVTALRTAAIATDPGIAESMTASPGGSTTEVNVMVTTPPPGEPAPVAASVPVAAPAPVAAPPEPDPPTPMELYEQELRQQSRQDRKVGRGLLASGLVVAGTSYLITSLSGAVAIDRARDLTDDPTTEADEGRRGDRRRAYGRALLIPGVGPALAIARADTAMRAWAAGIAGLTQALGAGLAIVGTHRVLRARRLDRLSLSAMGSSRQAQVSLRVRF